jgi:hypothetical protein
MRYSCYSIFKCSKCGGDVRLIVRDDFDFVVGYVEVKCLCKGREVVRVATKKTSKKPLKSTKKH